MLLLFSGKLQEVNRNYVSGAIRSDEKLKQKYSTIRSCFKVRYDRWSRSGQKDPKNFSSFFGLTFRRKRLSTMGTKSLLLFSVLNCSSGRENSELLDFMILIIPSHAMV